MSKLAVTSRFGVTASWMCIFMTRSSGTFMPAGIPTAENSPLRTSFVRRVGLEYHARGKLKRQPPDHERADTHGFVPFSRTTTCPVGPAEDRVPSIWLRSYPKPYVPAKRSA